MSDGTLRVTVPLTAAERAFLDQALDAHPHATRTERQRVHDTALLAIIEARQAPARTTTATVTPLRPRTGSSSLTASGAPATVTRLTDRRRPVQGVLELGDTR